MLMNQLFADESTKSSIVERNELGSNELPPKSSSVSRTVSASDVSNQDAQCRHHTTRRCDCDRYFAQPGTAEYGC